MSVRMRPAYRAIELYDPRRTPCALDLSDNTNLFGVAPSLVKLLEAPPTALLTRYPPVFADELKQMLARRHRVEPENITTGCGSDDVIDSAMRAFCEPGDRVAYPIPTFGIVATFARMNAAEPAEVATNPDFSIEPDRLIAEGAAITYVCTPNNPTGLPVDADVVRGLDERLDGVLLLDEAYADFGADDHAGFAAASQRTISLRTMSKACGLAGLRVGYAIGPAALIREVEKSRGPYKVNAVADAAARGILSADRAWVDDVVAQTRVNRTQLAQRLRALGLTLWPSAANFILVKLPAGRMANEVNMALRARGVAVRPFANLPHAGDCIRVTVGPWEMMEEFLTTLAAVL
ncbi:MAG TPA: histidinol-phosphate transaminase [Longimicrobiales bacterium]